MRNANEHDNTALFKQLSDTDIALYRQWARDNWKPGDTINPVWHPVVRDEIGAIQEEHLARFDALTEQEVVNAKVIATEAIGETEQETEERGAGRTQLMTRRDADLGEGLFDSIAWAFSEHVKEPDNPAFNSAVLYGNDDAPVRIDFYTQESPEVSDTIARTWRPKPCCNDPRCGLPSDHTGPCIEEK